MRHVLEKKDLRGREEPYVWITKCFKFKVLEICMWIKLNLTRVEKVKENDNMQERWGLKS